MVWISSCTWLRTHSSSWSQTSLDWSLGCSIIFPMAVGASFLVLLLSRKGTCRLYLFAHPLMVPLPHSHERKSNNSTDLHTPALSFLALDGLLLRVASLVRDIYDSYSRAQTMNIASNLIMPDQIPALMADPISLSASDL